LREVGPPPNKNGVLNVHLPKSAGATPKAIEVKVS
jgi:hypothetical protein